MEIIEGKLYFIKNEFLEKYNPKYHLLVQSNIISIIILVIIKIVLSVLVIRKIPNKN